MKKLHFNIGFNRLLSACMLVLISSCINVSKAVQLPTITQRIDTDPTTLAPVNVGATTFVEINPKTGAFTDISVVNTVEFGYNPNYLWTVPATGTYTLDVEVTTYDQSNTITGVDTLLMSIHYDPASTNPVQDKDVRLIMNAWRLDAKIIALNGAPTGSLPINMYLELRLDIDRVYDFASVLNTGPVINSVNLINIDGIPGGDEIEVNWTSLTGTDEYQLEWTYIDNYDTILNDTLPVNTLAFDFRHNSTRITTTALSYRIANLFDRGWVLFRLRAAGRDMLNPNDYLFTVWNNNTPNSGSNASVVTAKIKILTPHEASKNWQATTTYAEEGKKKDVVSYFDGSLRNRQTVTRINSDENVVVGETIYDHQGRPAITALPAPVDRDTINEPALHYYNNFNVNMSGNPYNRENFDLDDTTASPCNDTVQPMDTTSGASRYYSGNSTLIDGNQAFVPDAHKYPFSQVEYTPDNTGRIRRQSGVGKDFQLNSGHETKYLYGQPNQLQIDRLFGSEAGDAAHYKKNVVIDPNGQASISILDMSGRVIATSLAGNSPENLDSLKYDSTAKVMLIDLFAKDANGNSQLNTPNISQNAIEFSTQLLVPYAASYVFNYDFVVPPFTDTCLADSICFNCVYNLTLRITNECGENIVQYGSNGDPIDSMVVGRFDTDSLGNIVFLTACSDTTYDFDPYSDTLFLPVGSYTISKILTVNEDAVNFYVDAYLDPDNNHCIKTLEDFENDYLSQVDSSSCEIDCDDCIANLGDRDAFVAQGGSYAEYDMLYETCLEDCKKMLSPCEAAYEMMLADMSPGGQYGQYLDGSGNTDPSSFLLSVYNINNHLPGNLTTTGGVTQNGTWHYPVTVLNGNTYNHYINDDGSFGTVNVFDNGSGYTPAFTGLPLVDGNGQEYVYAENLVNLSDFIAAFRPEWAKGLVHLHPEYCYYEKCKEYGENQGSETFSSDEYSYWLNLASTFQEAQTGLSGVPYGGKFINGSGIPYNPSVPSTTNLYDPFLDPANSGIYGTASAQFMARWNQYLPNPGGGWYNMYQAAAVTIRCGGLYGLIPGASCDDFGQPVIGLTPAQMTELLNEEWNTYKGFYAALKNEIQQNLADQYALTTCNGINDCIGNDDDFNPFVSGMIDYISWGNSAYFEEQQPCSYFTRSLYASKQTRFPDAQVIPTHNMTTSEAGYQAYLQTGQCPKAMGLEGILNEMAGNTKLDIATAEPLLPYLSYNTFYLIDNNYTPSTAITTNPLNWQATTVTANYINVDFVDASSSIKLRFELDKTGSGITNWDDIVMLSNLQSGPSTATTYPYQFTITARVETDTLDTCIVLNGSTTYPISNCNFQEVCNANPFAKDIQTLMSALAATSQLVSASVALNPTYDLMTSAGIRTKMGVAPATNLTWSFNSGTNTWSLYPTAGAPPQFEFKIVSYTPSSFNLANLSLIKSFTGIKSAYQNFFTIEGRDASNNLLVTLKCSAKHTNAASVVSPVEMGECGLPVPLVCQTDPYVITDDLGDIFFEALISQFNGGNIDLMALSSMSTTVASHLGTDSTYSTYLKDTTGPVYQDSLIFHIDGCEFILTTNSTSSAFHLDAIAGLSQAIATGPAGFDNYQHEFFMLAQSGGQTDSIHAYVDCLPLANCHPCPDSAEINIDFPTDTAGTGGNGSRKMLFTASGTKGEEGTFETRGDGGMSEEECAEVYASYQQLIKDYNASKYSIQTGHTLPQPYASLSDFYNAGLCDCYTGYYNYLVPYLANPPNLSLPHPVTIDEFCSSTDSCYAVYLELIERYNSSYYATNTGFFLTAQDAIDCNCLEAYAAYLELYINTTNTHFPSPLSISEYPCSDCYRQYQLLIDLYNASDYAANTGFTLRYDSRINCDCLDEYTNYLSIYINTTNYSLPNPLTITEYPCDDCYAQYQLQIDLYNASYYADQTGYTLEYADSVNCDCYQLYAEYLEDYINATTTELPQPVSITIFCDSCFTTYNEYVTLVNAYNNSDYVSQTGFTMPLVFADAASFIAAGVCDCFEAYSTYLQPYLVMPANTSLPAPVTIDMYEGCEQYDTLREDTCEHAYQLYITNVNAYNNFALNNGIPLIEPYGSGSFTAEGYCYCVNGYVAILQSIVSGDYSISYALANGDLLDIALYCEDRLTPPCTPEVNLFDMCKTRELPPIPYTNPCIEQLVQNALENAEQAYNQYIQELTTQIADAYRQHCMGAVETFTAKYTDKEYHYTLYYYDQPGNLIKTIPPAGVNMLSFDSDNDGVHSYTDPVAQQILQDRVNHTQTVFTYHGLPTTYEYNSLNQLVKQNMPDHEQMDIWATSLPNGLDPTMTVTEIQYIDGSVGYLTGYTSNRGLLYRTIDGGNTWQKVNDLVAANINQVYMVNNTTGYAVADHGILLQTLNGGSSWDMLKTYESNINWDLQALYFISTTDGILVGEHNKSIKVTNATTAPVFTPSAAFPNSSYTAGGYFKVTAITYDSPDYIASARHKASASAPETGRMYISTDGGLTWTEYTQFNAPDLNKVNYYSTNNLVSAGNAGSLNDITISGSSNFYIDLVSGATGKVRDVYYINNSEGVAIIENTSSMGDIYSTSDGGKTWNLMSNPGENYYRFEVYATGSMHKLIAAGDNGLVSRVIVQTNTPFGIIPLTTITTPAAPDLKAAWAEVSGTNVPALVGGDSAALYFTLNAGATTVNWSSVSSVVPAGEHIIRLAGQTFGSGSSMTITCIALSDAGKMYGIHRSSTGIFSTSAITIAGTSFSDITHQSGFVYAYDNTNKKVYRVQLLSTGVGSNMAFANSNSPGTPDIISIDLPSTGNDLIAVGKMGATWKGRLNSPSSGQVTWTDITVAQIPLGFTDLKYVNATNKTYATTVNGNVYVNSGSSSWQQMEVASSADFNAIALNNTGVNGALAANNGVAYYFTFTGNQLNLTPVVTSTTENLHDVIVAGVQMVLVGEQGVQLQVPSYTTNSIASPVTSTGNNDLYTLVLRPSANEVITAGEWANIRKINGNFSMKVNQVYVPTLNSVHFINASEGYVVGKQYTARHTTDGGATWHVVAEGGTWSYSSTTLPELNGVHTHAAGKATIVGSQGRISETDNNTYTSILSNAGDVYHDVAFSNSSKGFIVGGNGSSARVYSTTDAGANWNIVGGYSSASGNLRTVHAFSRNDAFLAAGTNNLILYGDGSGLTLPDASLNTPPTGGSTIFNDIYCYDDIHFYLVGNDNVFLKSENTTLFTSGPNSGHYQTGSWVAKTVSDDLLNQNTTNGSFNINAIAMSSFTTGSVGGWFSDLGSAPVVQTCYARKLVDESQLYSTKFWYDKLGRIVVSQNSRQYNDTDRKYSYTRYDALGRVIEAGEKTENTTAGNQFSNIFGSVVNSFYNPNTIDDIKLTNWIEDTTGIRMQVTHTYYDRIYPAFASLLPVSFDQDHLRKRIATVTYEDTLNTDTTIYDHATHYSYDIHGNVKTLLQENQLLATNAPDGVNLPGERFKRMDYTYDLISGNVHKVSYQSGEPDQWHHRYEYDADNRITEVETSTDNVIWDNDAKYHYYAHGPLARTELGHDKVQGQDYAYTLQGWIKGVNSNSLVAKNDMGHDAVVGYSNPNSLFAKDVYGYTLNYYDNDYTPIDASKWTNVRKRFEADKTGSDFLAANDGLFNGNIRSMATTIVNPNTGDAMPNGMKYRYDQLNRLIKAQGYGNLDINQANATYNKWGSGSTYNNRYHNEFTYDPNGNIMTQTRYDEAGGQIEDLTYRYFTENGQLMQNRLYHVNETIGRHLYPDDIDDQVNGLGTGDSTYFGDPDSVKIWNNYRYDGEGRLIQDLSEEIAQIVWRVDGKVREVLRTPGSTRKKLLFQYDAMGNRIAKHVFNNATGAHERSTYYSRDAQGNVMAVYEKDIDTTTTDTASAHKVIERHIYGSSRIGMNTKKVEMIGAPPVSAVAFAHELGLKQFELSNHLGNVLAVISDKKRPVDDGDYDMDNDTINDSDTTMGPIDGLVDWYKADVVSTSDYYPFGIGIGERSFSITTYRYGFNQMESYDELAGEKVEYDFGARLIDTRIGRFFTLDPEAANYASHSNYSFAINNPILFIDPTGKVVVIYYTNKRGKEKQVTISSNKDLEKYKNHRNSFVKSTVEQMNKNIKTMPNGQVATGITREETTNIRETNDGSYFVGATQTIYFNPNQTIELINDDVYKEYMAKREAAQKFLKEHVDQYGNLSDEDFDTYVGMQYEAEDYKNSNGNGAMRYADDALNGEFGHSNGYLDNPEQVKKDELIPDELMGNKEERRVLDIENEYAKAKGEKVMRTNHGGIDRSKNKKAE